MRLLHLSDTHLGAELHVSGHPRGWHRAQDHLKAFQLALAPAFAGQVDAVVHSGDLFDRSHPPAEVVAAARWLLDSVSRQVPVVIVAGNHDRFGIGHHFPNPPQNLHLVDGVARVVIGDLALGCLAYRRTAQAWTAEAAHLAAQGVDALVCHQSFHGERIPGFVFRDGSPDETVGAPGIPKDIRYILCGHIHPRQVVRLGGTFIVDAGSTERTSFGEGAAPKGYVLWDWGREVRWRWADVPSRPRGWVERESDLTGVVPGALIGVPREAPNELLTLVRARGGWLVGRRPMAVEPRQTSLFDEMTIAPMGEKVGVYG